MEKETKHEVARGIGMAIGVVFRIGINLGSLWIGLWLLNQFGWLPF